MQAAREKNEIHLDQFDMLTARSGWVLLDQHLFWTSDAGRTWSEMGPALPPGAVIQDVSFLDATTGWLLWTSSVSEGEVVFQLAHTVDRGMTWNTHSLPLFSPGEIASYAEKAEMGWLDERSGWISVKQSSGSNFSVGTLFTTSDGGDSWKRAVLPVADQISFSDPQVGWAVGGPAGDQIFKTENAGVSWQNARPDDLPADTAFTVYMPFSSGKEGMLVLSNPGPEHGVRVYSLGDAGNRWVLADQLRLEVESENMGLSILDSRNFVATIPGTNAVIQMAADELNLIDNQDGLSGSIVQLDMVSREVGWAKSVESNCIRSAGPERETASVSCSSLTRFLQTSDGGRTWQNIDLPSPQREVFSNSFSVAERSFVMEATASSGNTEVFIGQGFDKCTIPTLSQLQTWWNSSPYGAVNLYIGGSSRACANSALTLPYIEQIYQQGWKLIPTWVGPQAPCTGFRSRFSGDITTAYNEGINEANLAADRLVELGLTTPDGTGSVVYYDIEQYGTTDSACRSAVNAFMNGWVSQLHARGNTAGVYASTLCDTGLSDFRTIANVPDVIWPARWHHGYGLGYYDPDASVWNLGSCVPNTAWANHQRIRQYEGGHAETWGNLTLEIDSNVLDGVVAIPNMSPFVNSIDRVNETPTQAATVDFRLTFSEAVTGVDAGDLRLIIEGVSGATITGISGSGDTYTVSVNTGSGSGTLRLEVPVTATITDLALNPLVSLPFHGGEIYSIEKDNGIWHIREQSSVPYGAPGDIPLPADYDGDGDDDIAIFRPFNSTWYILGVGTFLYGAVDDIPVVADYTGDGKAEIAVFRPSNNTWYIRGVGRFVFGTLGDIPVPADYNGDAKAEIAVFHPSNSTWSILGMDSYIYGTAGDIPAVTDYNEDGKADIAVFRPSNSTWYIRGVGRFVYGAPEDVPVVGDYNGDGKAEIAVFRPSNSTWYIRGIGRAVYGQAGDIPVAADYNGDGKDDIAVFRP